MESATPTTRRRLTKLSKRADPYFLQILMDTISVNFATSLMKHATAQKIDYLNESNSLCRQLVDPQAFPFIILPHLSRCLLYCFQFFPGYCTQDLSESLEILSRYVGNACASLPDRFLQACIWAFFARDTRHTTVSKAYETALSLIQNAVLFHQLCS